MKKYILFFALILAVVQLFGQSYQIPKAVSYSIIGENQSGSGFPTGDSISNGDQLGYSIARIGDIDNDGIEDIAIGAPYDDDGGSNRGAVWICLMADDNTVDSWKKLSDIQGNFDGTLADDDNFGFSVAGIGDLDNDGVPDIVIGAAYNDDDGSNTGAVWIVFMNSDGSAKSGAVKIQDTDLTLDLLADDNFGFSVAGLGDVDGDGNEDIAVGIPGRNFIVNNVGIVVILFLDSDGSLLGENAFFASGGITADDQFGYSLSVYPDADNDTINELLVGMPYDDDGGTNYGAVFLFLLNDDGTVKPSYEKYHSPIFDSREYYIVPAGNVILGASVASLDINQDGIYDMVVGVPSDNSFYAIILNESQDDVQWRKFGSDFAWDITFSGINFGRSCTGINDNDGDGNIEILVGAPTANGNGTTEGIVYVLNLDSLNYDNYHGNITKYHKISDISGGFTGTIDNSDAWGTEVCSLGDLDGDGNEDIAVGVAFDDDGGTNRGAVWILFLDSEGVVSSHAKINDASLGGGVLSNDCRFGEGITNMGDLDGDDVIDIAVSIRQDDDGGASSSANRGAAIVIFLNSNGTVKGSQKISHTQGGLGGVLADGDWFGAVANIGDLDNDGINDMAVGVSRDDDGGLTNSGAVWILFMNTNGTVKDTTKLSPTNGALSAYVSLVANEAFGATVEGIGDFDGDGNEDIVVSSSANTTGAVYLVFLDDDGTALGARKINNAASNFPETLESAPAFGCQLACPGDLDGNGYPDLLIGSQNHVGIGTSQRGCVWVAYMGEDGDVLEAKIIDDFKSDFYGLIENGDVFGNTVAAMQTDINNDGAVDIFIGARNEDDGGSGRGAVYMVSFVPKGLSNKYVMLEHDLDNEYYNATQKVLKVMYDEEYDVGSSSYLEYKVYNESRTVVAELSASGTTSISGSPTIPISYGENFITMDFTTLALSSGYYVLEVTGRKSDKYYLRFKI